MMHKSLPLFIVSILALVAYTFESPRASASEINYGSLKDQKGDTLLVEYKSPAGARHYTCTLPGTKCKYRGTTTPALFPTILGSKTYPKNPDGTKAVRTMTAGSKVYYFLYDISSKKPKKKALIPYPNTGATVSFSKDGNAVIFTNGRTYTKYDIATKKLSTVTLPKELSFMSISPKATYVTGYNYGTLKHELWRFADGKKVDGPSAMQSYLEFSEDEKKVAFLDDVGGFRTLFYMDASDLGNTSTPSRTQLTKPNTETEDYLFVSDTLYFMANVDGPLEWDLFAYDGKTTDVVDHDVSYGDYLKRVKTSDHTYLAYLKNEGKNSNLILTSPNPGEKIAFAPVSPSPLSDNIIREVKTYGKRTGVLLSPADGGTKKRNLFIWMHGGPQRQVAKEYHPYLSYAVYDELLDRLVEGGNYVYKIDYSGSTGYGATFKKSLDMKIGDVEMKDIKNAIHDIKKDKSIDKVYLIGNSYGGYMAFRGLVGMPELVQGIVSIAGVSDWYGLIDAIPSSPFRELFNGVPDTHNLDAYKKASVFTGMDKLKSDKKILVVWGEQDSTVPVSQSTKYLEFAKAQGVKTSSLSFPDEDHIIRKRSNLDKLCKAVTSTLELKGVGCVL
jgi:dipeptidyl aminopeptidase/acylaminoacyl peptidase